jgi:hypothetical protein
MARRHTLGLGWGLGLLLAGVSGCSSSTPRDINYGTDAGAGFEAPVRETEPETAVGGSGGGGTAGSGGQGGAAGGGGAGGDNDAATD